MLMDQLANFPVGIQSAQAFLVVPVDQLVSLIVQTLIFSAIGLAIFGVAFWIMGKVSPFSLRKELEEDQNTALAIVLAAVIIGIALIVSAGIQG